MAYMTTTLIARPGNQNLGALGSFLDSIGGAVKSVASGALDLYGSGLKAQGAQEALAAQLAAQQQQQQQQQARGGGGISTTTLLIGGAALAGVLVFAMRRK